ncbi:TPA: outer membrane protein transport protein [Vibrio parahaemolyticus]|nr:outer membrane protein transport protein [Vibrio parahaemolyticus]
MTQNTRLFKKTLLAVTVAFASGQSMAAGFQINAQSATGIGRAFAGDAVIADNASVMARNPAAMALFDKMELSLGFESITSMIEVKDAKYRNFMGQSVDVADTDDVGDTSIAPNIHLIVPVNDKFAWGVNAYSNFGTKTEFSDNYTATEYGGLTDVKSANFGLAGSYRLNEQWSFGAGVDLIYGQGTMKRTTSSSIPLVGGKKILDVDKADGWAVGFNVGTVYELDENNRFGLAYRYSPEFTAKDDKGQEITLPLPDMAEFSGFHKIQDTKFAVHYSIQYIGWKDFDQIDFENLNQGLLKGGYSKDYQWQDGWHYAIGGTYYLNNNWTLRAGYMYDNSSNIDFGFTYLLGDDVKVNENTQLAPGLSTGVTATTHADAILFGLQYSRSF